MEVAAGAVAIIGLASEMLRVYERLDRCFKNLKGAREDVGRVCSETETFSLLLSHFHSTVSQPEAINAGLSADIKTLVIPRIVEDGISTVRKIESLLHKLHPLRSDKRSSRVANAAAKYLWLNRRPEVLEILTNLSCIKSTAAWLTGQISLCLIIQEMRDRAAMQAGHAFMPKHVVERLCVPLHMLSLLSTNPFNRSDGPPRVFYIKQNQKLQSRCSELEEECRVARKQASAISSGAVTSGIIGTARRVITTHLNENQGIRQLLSQPPENVEVYVKNNIDMFRNHMDGQQTDSTSSNATPASMAGSTSHSADSTSLTPYVSAPSMSSQSDMQRTRRSLTPSGPSSMASIISEQIIVSERVIALADDHPSQAHKARYPSIKVKVNSCGSPPKRPPPFYFF